MCTGTIPPMRYAKALAAALACIVVGGTILRFIAPGSWQSHAVTLATFVAAALAARWSLRG